MAKTPRKTGGTAIPIAGIAADLPSSGQGGVGGRAIDIGLLKNTIGAILKGESPEASQNDLSFAFLMEANQRVKEVMERLQHDMQVGSNVVTSIDKIGGVLTIANESQETESGTSFEQSSGMDRITADALGADIRRGMSATLSDDFARLLQRIDNRIESEREAMDGVIRRLSAAA